MITLDVKTKVDTTESESSVDRLTKSMDKLVELQEQTLKEQSKLNDEVAKSSEETKKSLSNLNKATKLLAGGFKGVGLAIKAAGLKLLFGAMNALKDVFMQNQEVADTVASAFEAVSIVFNEIVGYVIDTVKEVSAASNGFEKLGKVISGLLTLAFTPLKLSFYGIVLGVQQAQLAWEKSFFGDKDPKTIKELSASIEETKESISEVGQEAVAAGIKVVENYAGAVSEVSDVVVGSVEKIKKISIEAAIEQGKTNTELKNNAELAAARQSRLIEQYDRQAESLRQVRDLESNSISERVKANEDLAALLDKQEEAMLKQADLQIKAAQARVDINNSIENQVALTEALANREGVLAQVKGFRSEQQSNINGLTREANQLTQTQIEGDQERARQLRELGIEEEQDAAKKLDLMRENLAKEEEIILENLERKRELYAEGTQARIDAEEEYLNKKQELEIKGEEIEAKSADNSISIEKDKESAKKQLLSDGFKIAGELSSKNAKAQKGIAATEATINTLTAITGTLRGLSKSSAPGLAIAQAVATGIFGMLQVQKILSTSVNSGSSPSVSSPSGSGVTSASSEANQDSDIPNFDFINQGVGGNAGARLNRSYVVNQDIKDQNQLAEKVEDISVTA